MLTAFSWRSLLLRCGRLKMALVTVLTVVGASGCGATAGQENDYTCNGICSGEPMPELIIQAPDPETACTEYLENCRGQGTCSSCS
jgi:hypothetical protein